jgi:hypothetical protein
LISGQCPPSASTARIRDKDQCGSDADAHQYVSRHHKSSFDS